MTDTLTKDVVCSFLWSTVFSNVVEKPFLKIKNIQMEEVFSCNSLKANYFLSEKEEFNRCYKGILKVGQFWLYGKEDNLIKDIAKFRVLPAVSVCIPVHASRLNNLKYSLEYWANQDFIHPLLVEVVIVVNGSVEQDSLMRLKKELNKYQFKYVLIHLSEANLGRARSVAVSASTSEIVLLVNDDTIPNRDLIYQHLTFQAKFFSEKVGILGVFELPHNLIKSERDKQLVKHCLDFEQNCLKEGVYEGNFCVTNNFSIRKELIYASGNFNPLFKLGAEDSDLGERLKKIGVKIFFSPKIKAKHFHPNYLDNLEQVFYNRGKTGSLLNQEYRQILALLVGNMSRIDEEELERIFKECDNGDFWFVWLKNMFSFYKGMYDGLREFWEFSLKDSLLPKVSIIIPVFNGEKFVSKAIESVLKQTYKNFEVIIVDDCSSDCTWDIVNSYSEKYSNIKVLRNKENLGPAGSRNVGILSSTGKYVAFLDADDLMFPYSLELRVLAAELRGAKFLFGNYFVKERNRLFYKNMVYPKNFKEFLLYQIGGNIFPIGTVFVDKELLLKVGGFDETLEYAEDFDLWNRLILELKGDIEQIMKLQVPLYIYNIHENQLTREYRESKHSVSKQIIKLFSLLEENYREVLDDDFIMLSFLKLLERDNYEDVSEAILYLYLKLKEKDRKKASKIKKLLLRVKGEKIYSVLKKGGRI